MTAGGRLALAGRLAPAGAVVLATAFVAVTAFVLAYDGSRGAASDAGITAAGWYPFCIEGAIVCGSVGTILLRGERFPWVLLLVGTAISTGTNVLHAWERPGWEWWSLLIAALPPLALPACVHLMLRALGSTRPATVVATTPAGATARPVVAAASVPGPARMTAYAGPPVPFGRREKGRCDCGCGGKAVSWETWRRHHPTSPDTDLRSTP